MTGWAFRKVRGMCLLCWPVQAGLNRSWLQALQRMVGFRNIAVHDYQSLQLPITVAIIEKHLDEFFAGTARPSCCTTLCDFGRRSNHPHHGFHHTFFTRCIWRRCILHCRPPAAPGCVSSATGRVTGACGCFAHWCWSACVPNWSATTSPLIVRYEGQTYFPMLRDYSEKNLRGDFDTPTDYLDPSSSSG